MKKVILLSCILLFIGACENRCRPKGANSKGLNSVIFDERCQKLRTEAIKKGKELGVCYDGPLTQGIDIKAKDADPDHIACKALLNKAQKKCDALPPDPKSKKPLSRSTTVHNGNVIVDGKRVSKKKLPWCDECPTCKPISPNRK